MRTLPRTLILVFLAVLAGRAEGDKSNELAEARRHYSDATAAYNLGEFARAAEEYKAAYKLAPDPVILYNIAQSYRLASDFPQALFFYHSFIRNTPNARNREEVEGRIATLELQLARAKEVAQAPPNGVVTTGKSLPEPSPPTVAEERPLPSPAPPTHIVSTSPGSITLAAREPAPKTPTPVYKKWWLWTAVGGVVLGSAVGIGLGVGLSSGPTPPSSHFGTLKLFP